MAQAPVAETKFWAALWEKLKAENAPLRIVKDGLPCSAPADFFDPWLRADLAQYPEEDDFHIAFRSMEQYQATYGGTFSIYYLLHRTAVLQKERSEKTKKLAQKRQRLRKWHRRYAVFRN